MSENGQSELLSFLNFRASSELTFVILLDHTTKHPIKYRKKNTILLILYLKGHKKKVPESTPGAQKKFLKNKGLSINTSALFRPFNCVELFLFCTM